MSGKNVKGQGGPWPPKRRYAVAVNAQRLKGEFKPKRRAKKSSRRRKK